MKRSAEERANRVLTRLAPVAESLCSHVTSESARAFAERLRSELAFERVPRAEAQAAARRLCTGLVVAASNVPQEQATVFFNAVTSVFDIDEVSVTVPPPEKR